MNLRPGMRIKENGSIEYRVTINGKQKSFTAKTVKQCLQKELDYMQKLANDEPVKNENITFEQYFEEWTEKRSLTVKPNTIRKDIGLFKNQIPAEMKRMKVRDIERRYITNLQAKLAKEYSANTTNEAILLINRVMKVAVLDDIINKNPASDIPIVVDKEVKPKANKTIHRALKDDECKFLIDEIKEYCPWYYENFAFMLCSGIRVGELCALSWNEVDFKNKKIYIKYTETRTADGKFTRGKPKTANSERTIPMSDQMRTILLNQKSKIIINSVENYVFPTVKGRMLGGSALTNKLHKVIDRINEKGIPFERISCHALRDTFATKFIMSGGQANTLKEILGHSSISITMDIYAQVFEETKTDSMNMVKMII